ncbi:MAG TPA: hypothetical protein VLS88_14220 [Polyangiales bacterium]|nr:hypothetical protein [Polyangiales bacterium]
MKTIYGSMLGFALVAFLMAGCGDDNGIGGVGGDLFCASDNPDVGETIDCPSGEQTLDFCVNTRNGNCYYVIGGEQVDCGNCLENDFNIGGCAQDAVALCD